MGYLTIRIPYPSIQLTSILVLVLLAACLGTATYMAAPVAYVPNNWYYVPNGDFEFNPTNWPPQLDKQPGIFSPTSERAATGKHSMKATPTGDLAFQGFANISNPIPVCKGQKYVLSANFYTEQMPGRLYIDFAQENGLRLDSLPRQKGWQFQFLYFTATSDKIRLRLVCDGHATAGDYGYIDSIAVTPDKDFKD